MNWVKLSRAGKLKKVVGKTGVTTKQVEIAIGDLEDETEAIVGELQVDLTSSTLMTMNHAALEDAGGAQCLKSSSELP